MPVNNIDIIPGSPQDLANKIAQANAQIPTQTPALIPAPTEAPQPVQPAIAPELQPTQAGAELTATPAPIPVQKEVTKVETTPNATTTTKETPAPVADPNIRNQEILKNLNEGLKNDPTAQQAINSGNADLFKSKYSSQNPAEQKIIDDYFNAHTPKDSESIFNLLRTGQSQFNDSIKNTPTYKEAQARYAKFRQFSGYETPQLSASIKNGYIVPGSQSYNDLLNDPLVGPKLKSAENLNAINKTSIDLVKAGENQTNDILSANTKTKIALDDGVLTGEEYKAMLETPEITEKRKDVEAKKNEYDTLKATYDNTKTEVEKEYKGKISNSAIRNIINERRENMQFDLQLASDTYNNSIGTLTDMTKTQASVVEMNYDMWKTKESRAYDSQQLTEKRAYDEAQAQKDLQNKFDYTYGDLKSKDPRIQQVAAEKMAAAIQEQYKGMPFRRDVATMGKDIAAAINAGKTTEQITTDITNAIQNAPDYANWKANNKALAVPGSEGQFSMGFDPITGQPYVLNAHTGQIQGSEGMANGNGGTSGTGTGGLNFNTTSTDMRTDRNNNPAAFTTDIAKQAGLIEGVDYVKGDSFGNGKYFTAKLLGDPVATTIKTIDAIGFKTKSGANRWTYSDNIGLNNQTWAGMDNAQKQLAVAKMYQQEGGNGSLVKGVLASIPTNQPSNDNGFTPNESQIFESLRGKTPIEMQKALGSRDVSRAVDYLRQNPLSPKETKEMDQKLKQNVIDEINRFKTSDVAKNINTITNQYKTLESAAKRDTAAGDLSLIFAYMKIVDPTSTVREGEFANAQNAASLPDQIVNQYNKVISGERLNPNQRNDFVTTAKGLVQANIGTYKQGLESVKQNAKFLGADLNSEEIKGVFSPLEKDISSIVSKEKPKTYTFKSTIPGVAPHTGKIGDGYNDKVQATINSLKKQGKKADEIKNLMNGQIKNINVYQF